MVGILVAGWRTGMLRERNPDPNTTGSLPPFSLGRVQLAWWLFLTVGGFLFVWLLTGQFENVLNDGALTLLGISGVSGLTARLIEQNLSEPPTVSHSFLKDILSDGSSLVLQRVQMFAWTLILGLIFAWTTVWNLAFPVFGQHLLVLAGLVNGTYLGFKFPEITQKKIDAAEKK